MLLAFKYKGAKVGEIVKEFFAVPIVSQIMSVLEVSKAKVQEKERYSKMALQKLEVQLINVSSIF